MSVQGNQKRPGAYQAPHGRCRPATARSRRGGFGAPPGRTATWPRRRPPRRPPAAAPGMTANAPPLTHSTNITPRLAAEGTVRTSGLARGFRVAFWAAQPEIAMPLPIIRVMITRGNRKSRRPSLPIRTGFRTTVARSCRVGSPARRASQPRPLTGARPSQLRGIRLGTASGYARHASPRLAAAHDSAERWPCSERLMKNAAPRAIVQIPIGMSRP